MIKINGQFSIEIDINNPYDVIEKHKGSFAGTIAKSFMSYESVTQKVDQKVADELYNNLISSFADNLRKKIQNGLLEKEVESCIDVNFGITFLNTY
jgi:hypothetical protein